MIDLEQFRILIRTEIQNSKDLDSLKGKLQETKKETSYTASAFKDMGGSLAASLGGAALAAAAFSAASQFVGDSVKEAGDAAEQASKFNVVFGDSAGKASQEISEFADSAGRSKYELTAMASSVQDTFVPLGFAREKAAGLSVELVKLATDVASFNNSSDTEVMQNFQSALVGQGEAVRKYGIIITETTLGQELMNMGIAGGAKAASEQEKVQARLNLLYKGTTDAQGDAARTADSYVNTQKALAAATKSLQVAFGKELTPALAEATRGLIDYVKFAENMIEITSEMNKENSGLIEGLLLIYNAVPGLTVAAKSTGSLMAEFNKWKATQDEAKKSTEGFTGVLPAFAAAMGTVAEKEIDAKEAAAALKDEINRTKAGFGYLNDMIAGEVTKSFDDFLSKQTETKDKLAEIKDQMAELRATPWKDWSGSKSYDLAKQFTEEKLKLGELTKEYEKNTQAMLLNMAQKYLSAQVDSGSLSSLDAMKAVNRMAEMWGMIDKPTALLNDAMADLVSQYATGALTLDQFSTKAQALNDAAVGAASSAKSSTEFADKYGESVSKIPGLVTTQIKIETPSADFVKGMLDGLPAEKTIKINIETPSNTLDAFRKMDEKFTAQKITVTADTASAKLEIKSVQEILDSYPEKISTNVMTTGTKEANSDANSVKLSFMGIPESKEIRINTSGKQQVLYDFWEINKNIDALRNKDYYVTVHVRREDYESQDSINPTINASSGTTANSTPQVANYNFYQPVTFSSDSTLANDLQARRF